MRTIPNLYGTSLHTFLCSITETEKLLQSPRYGCRKGHVSGNHYGYRPSDFCLYNVSILSCESGSLLIESATDNDQELEARLRDENGDVVCSDYLQFYYGNSSTQRYCGTELSDATTGDTSHSVSGCVLD